MVDRADRLDGQINAIIQRDLDRTRATADAADAAIAAGQPLGPLHGVPMTVKDSFQTEGCITPQGPRNLPTLFLRRMPTPWRVCVMPVR